MLENMNLNFMRLRLHGVGSTLTFLKDVQRSLVETATLASDFTVTKQFDSAIGAYADKITVRLDSDEKLAAFESASVIDLQVRGRTTRYRFEDKRTTPQYETIFGFGTVVMIKNERTPITA
jgi:hypothetical protein